MIKVPFKMQGRQMQYLAALSASFLITSPSMHLAWSSPTLPILQNATTTPLQEPLTDAEASWVVSIFLIAAVPSTPLVPYLITKTGEKNTLLMATVLIFIPWLLYIFATHVWIIYLARSLAGFAIGLITTGSAMYTGEIADSDIRGKLSSTVGLLKLIGAFITLTAGPYVSYTNLSVIGAVITAISFIIFFLMPKSPYYLTKTGQIDEARRVVRIFAGSAATEEHIDKKMLEIQNTIENDTNQGGYLDFIKAKEYRRAIGIMVIAKTTQMLSGVAAIESYLGTIILNSDSNVSAGVSSILFGAVQFPAVILSMLMVDRVGRKPIFIISAVGSALGLTVLGVYFLVQDYLKADTSHITWLPTTALIFYVISVGFGIISLPYVLISELFPTNIKEIAVTILTTYGLILAAGVTKLFDPITSHFGYYTMFWMFGGCCLVGGLSIFLVLPETKGKTFLEIQQKLQRKSKSNHT